MRSLTRPWDASAQRPPISFKMLCQLEPLGASVPSLIVTSCCADATGAAATRARASAARHRWWNGAAVRAGREPEEDDAVFFTGISDRAMSQSREEVVGVGEEEPRPPAGEDVGETVGAVALHLGVGDLGEQPGELPPVLPGHRDRLGVSDDGAELPPSREHEGAVEVFARAAERVVAAPHRLPRDEEL